jgi:hypothetical protein
MISLEVLSKVINPECKKGYFPFSRTGILSGFTVLLENLLFFFWG